MSYRVETATRTHPANFHQTGPICRRLNAAFEIIEEIKGDTGIRIIRIKDLSRKNDKKDPIIFLFDKGLSEPLWTIST